MLSLRVTFLKSKKKKKNGNEETTETMLSLK